MKRMKRVQINFGNQERHWTINIGPLREKDVSQIIIAGLSEWTDGCMNMPLVGR